jgi:hypothetical protein
LLWLRTFERPSHDTLPIWGNIRCATPNFTRRWSCSTKLGERVAAGRTTAMLPSALQGVGGVGKTLMANRVHLRDYDLVWWIQASYAIPAL